MIKPNGKSYFAEIIYNFNTPIFYQDYFKIYGIKTESIAKKRTLADTEYADKHFIYKLFCALEEACNNLKLLPVYPTDIVHWKLKGDFCAAASFYANIEDDKECCPKRSDKFTVEWITFGTNKPAFLSLINLSSSNIEVK